MAESDASTAEVGVAQTLAQLRRIHGIAGELLDLKHQDGATLARLVLSEPSTGSDAPTRKAALAVVPLFEAEEETEARRSALEEALSDLDGLVLWTPPAATLPDLTDTDTLERIRAAAGALAMDERGEVGFPVTLAVRKVDDEGSYLSVQGGMSPHWARFTNQVFGQFQLDSTALRRLPEDAAKVTQLVDFIVLVANGIRTPGKTADAPAEDTWVLQRLPALAGARVIAAAPASEPEAGKPVRKALRTGTRSALRLLAESDATLRLVTYVGVFRAMAEETASIALRGLDPTSFAALDAAWLAADGEMRALFGPTAESRLTVI